MKYLDVVQGSPEWLAARAKHYCASDAPAMMGVGKYTTRTELIRQKATGDVPDVDANKQALFDRGHETEAQARVLVEEMIGEEMYPATVTDDEGLLLASLDGLTMDGTTGFEHKLFNADLAAAVRAKELPPAYYWQLEHQALVAGLERIIFVCSDGTREKFEWMEYRPVEGRAAALLAGWHQFGEDVRGYMHVEVAPVAVAAPVLALPAVSVQVEGSIAIISNLDRFGEKLTEFVAKLNMKPEDDQGFADAEKAVKVLQDAQDALQQAETMALAQTASIDEMRRTVAMYIETARTTRLALEKVVKTQKEAIRASILRAGKDAFDAHVASLNKRLGKFYMPSIATDFPGVMKGKRTVTSLRDAVDTELARAKIEANQVADRIQINLTTLHELASDYTHLFADTAQIVLKPNEDLTTLVKLRIAEFKAAEEKKLEAERERIRKEETAKLEAKAKADEAARVAAEAKARAEAEARAKADESARLFAEAKEKAEAQARDMEAARNTVTQQQVGMPVVSFDIAKVTASTTIRTRKPPADTEIRPNDIAIVEVIAMHFGVPESKALSWLMCMDFADVMGRIETDETA